MKDESNTMREPTRGEKLAGVDFNPGGLPSVAAIKAAAAAFIDAIDTATRSVKPGEAERMARNAIDRAIEAQMLAVKAMTWRH